MTIKSWKKKLCSWKIQIFFFFNSLPIFFLIWKKNLNNSDKFKLQFFCLCNHDHWSKSKMGIQKKVFFFKVLFSFLKKWTTNFNKKKINYYVLLIRFLLNFRVYLPIKRHWMCLLEGKNVFFRFVSVTRI